MWWEGDVKGERAESCIREEAGIPSVEAFRRRARKTLNLVRVRRESALGEKKRVWFCWSQCLKEDSRFVGLVEVDEESMAASERTGTFIFEPAA